jgi:hypothetical protein
MFKVILTCAISLSILGIISAPAQANRHMADVGRDLRCKEKIDPKHLTGDSLKAEWKKCRASPENYN